MNFCTCTLDRACPFPYLSLLDWNIHSTSFTHLATNKDDPLSLLVFFIFNTDIAVVKFGCRDKVSCNM